MDLLDGMTLLYVKLNSIIKWFFVLHPYVLILHYIVTTWISIFGYYLTSIILKNKDVEEGIWIVEKWEPTSWHQLHIFVPEVSGLRKKKYSHFRQICWLLSIINQNKDSDNYHWKQDWYFGYEKIFFCDWQRKVKC